MSLSAILLLLLVIMGVVLYLVYSYYTSKKPEIKLSFRIYQIDRIYKTTECIYHKTYDSYIEDIAKIESEGYFKFGYNLDIAESESTKSVNTSYMIHDKD